MTKAAPRIRTFVASVAILAFVAGVAVGVAGSKLLPQGPGTRIRASAQDMSAVFDRLALTPEQRRQVDAIVERSAPRSRAIMLETAERLRAVADSLDTELRTVLNPQQRARLDSMRSDARFLLKRKVRTAGGTRVDTLLDTSPTPRPSR